MKSNTNKQSGRSMIEMLGVLAIIGVLSAGGVAGYSSAMESYKVNKTIQMITDSAAKATFVFDKKASAGTNRDYYHSAALCEMHTIPDDICRTCKGSICKGYFGETISPRLTALQASHVLDDPFRTKEGVLRINTPSIYFYIAFSSEIPISSCARLVSNPAWANVNEVAVTWGLGEDEKVEMPLDVSEAEELCRAEMQTGSIDFYIMVYIKTAGFTIVE